MNKLLATLGLMIVASSVSSANPPEKWFYAYIDLNKDPSDRAFTTDTFIDFLPRASKAGYTAVVLSDYFLADIKLLSGARTESVKYLENLERVKVACKANNIEIIPEVMSVGSSGQILRNDPDLAEGAPVEDCEYAVANQGGLVAIVKDQANLIKSGNLNGTKDEIGDYFSLPETSFELSTDTSSNSGQSVVFANPNDVFLQRKEITVKPKHQYQWTFELKTEGLTHDPNTPLLFYSIISASDPEHGYRKLHRVNHDLKLADSQWHQYVVSFNSFKYKKVDIVIGLEDSTVGKVWLNNITLRQSQAANMLRRNDLPVVLKNTAGQKLKEADHFKITRHPEFGDYGQYDPSHEIAPIEIAPESQLVAGDTIRVSYFHAQMPDVEPHRVCCSLRHPNVMKIHSDQIQLLEKRLAPKRWFINHDEIRGMGHEPTATEVTPKISPATLLRSHLIKCLEVIKRKGGNKPVILNSDMYDPFHNAVTASQRESYYPMVNGSFTGSWIPITETELKDPPAITVWNWNLADGNARNRQREVASSFVHFKGLGYPQVVGSFYDVDDSRVRSHIDEAFRMAKSHAGTVSAVCYYTALHKYDHLERFAESAEKIFGK